MWLWCVVVCATLFLDSARSNAGLSSTSFSNELRSGFTRLFQNGIEQPLQSPFIILNPNTNPLLQQQPPRPATTFDPIATVGEYHAPRPRYELPQYQSWVIPYYFVPTRYHPPRGKRPNDVLVVVVKTNCSSTNDTKPADPKPPAGDDDEASNPDDDVEEVTIIAGGADNGKEPSRCVWAILSCCAPANAPVQYTCFDLLGCSTAFWDTDPCVPAIIRAALEQATKYYGTTAPTNRTMSAGDTPPAAEAPATDNVAVDLTSAMPASPSAATPAAVTAAPATAPATAPAAA